MYKDFTEMSVWKKGLEIVNETYILIERLPKYEQYALSNQIRNAAISIPANIAEGFGRHHAKEKINFYYYSRGSSNELRSHLLCAVSINHLVHEAIIGLNNKCLDLEKELNYLIQSLKP